VIFILGFRPGLVFNLLNQEIYDAESFEGGRNDLSTLCPNRGKMAGVQKVDVNLDQKEVTIEFDESQTKLDEVSVQIVEAGFEVVGN